jgi:hypothetical protein
VPRERAGDESQVQQNAEAGRDAYTAGLYQAVINFPPGGGQAEKPGLTRRVWGDVPARTASGPAVAGPGRPRYRVARSMICIHAGMLDSLTSAWTALYLSGSAHPSACLMAVS